MRVEEFNKKKYFSEASGSCSVVDSNISMVLNEYGIYEEKVIDESKIELNSLVEKVSPNLNQEISETEIANELYSDVKDINYDKRIGYYKSLYIGHVVEGDYRKNASSGGMGTWIFKELFERKLIDGIIHVKKNNDNDTTLFSYDISTSIEEIKAGAKTKYYPVEFSDVIKKVKETPGRYAIIGIPSFVMAIRLLAKNDEILNERIKYTVGLICGHQKSSKFAESLAWQVGITPGNLKNIDFRKKLLDKPADNYGVEITGMIDGKEVTIVKPTQELIGQDWGHGFFKTLASDFTDDVMNETADITIGDAWLPEYTSDSKGNNVIVVRNPEVDEIIKQSLQRGKLKLDIVDKEKIFKSQASHYRHTHDELPYRLYKKDTHKNWRPLMRVHASKEIPFPRRKIQDLRNKIATQSHIIYNKAVELNDFSYFENNMNRLTREYRLIYKLNRIKSSLLRVLKK